MVSSGITNASNKLWFVLMVTLVVLVAAILSFITVQSLPSYERDLFMIHKTPMLDSSSNNSRQASHMFGKKHHSNSDNNARKVQLYTDYVLVNKIPGSPGIFKVSDVNSIRKNQEEIVNSD